MNLMTSVNVDSKNYKLRMKIAMVGCKFASRILILSMNEYHLDGNVERNSTFVILNC